MRRKCVGSEICAVDGMKTIENMSHHFMQFQYLDDLKKEVKRYCGFMNSESVRTPANEALKFLSNPEIGLPIDSSTNPVVSAFSAILDHKKSSKTASSLISTMCNCLKLEVFTGDALSAIMRRLETFEDMDSDTTLKVIQLATTIVGSHFLEMHILQSILSLVFSFCDSKEELIRETSCAGAAQITNSFLSFAETKSDTLTTVNRRDIDLCFSMSCDNSVTFDNHMKKVVYLVLRDIVRLCCDQTALWVRVKNLSVKVGYGILESIIREHEPLLNSSQHFQRLINEAAKSAYKQDAPLSFCVKCVDVFMETLPGACSAIFGDFLKDLKKSSATLLRTLLFFRVLLVKNSTMIVRFCLKCDQNAKQLSTLISKLRDICDDATEDNRIDLSLAPKGYDYQIQDPVSAAVEITVYFVHSCYKAQNSALKILVSQTWADILLIFSIAAAVVKGECCYILLQGMHSLVVLTHELLLEDARGSAIGAFCTILVAPKGPEADEVRRVAYETVTSAIETAPAAFKGHWNKLITALSEFLWKPSSLDFTAGLPLVQVTEFANAYFSINDGAIETREWSMFGLSDVLIRNMDRFDKIWDTVEDSFCQTFSNTDSEEPSLRALFRLLEEGFTEKSECCLCRTLEKLFCTPERMSLESKSDTLEVIRQLVSQSGHLIQAGWPHLLNSLKPSNFESEEDLLNNAFRSVQMIASDMLFNLNAETQTLIIELIFEYCKQITDINVSLSAFGLLWNTVSVCKTEEMWRVIFSGIAPMIGHSVPDVALCAVNTFFSLIVSNSQSIPSPIFEQLASDMFMPIIDQFAEPREETEATQQLAFHQLAHCGRNLWNQFSSVPVFKTEFWKKLIDRHEIFMTKCQKREVRTSAFQFYEEVFLCDQLAPELLTRLFDSMDRLTDFFISHESNNCPLLGPLGRLIRIVLPVQKERLTEEILRRWLRIIEHSILDVNCNNFLPPTVHKSLDALTLLFPLPTNLTVMVYETLVKIASADKGNTDLNSVAIDHICTVCESVEKDILPTLFVMSTKIFKQRYAWRLLLDFVAKDVSVREDKIEHVSKSLMELAKDNAELSEKTATAIIKMFPKLCAETKQEYLTVYATNYFAISQILSLYCDVTSAQFDKEIAEMCTKTCIDHLSVILRNASKGDQLQEILKFLYHLRTDPAIYGRNSDYFHLFEMLPVVSDLVLHPDEPVRRRLRKILLRVSELRNSL